MITVGLTGQSGAGKTTVSRCFSDSGFEVINADRIAAEVMEKGQPCLAAVAEQFGESILNSDGRLNRKALAEIVFSDKSQLQKLNGIAYPFINRRVLYILNRYESGGAGGVLLDAPQLFESGEDKLCDIIVSVFAPFEMRLRRIIQRDDITAEAAEKRLKSQLSEEFFELHSQYIIDNKGSYEELEKRTKEIIKEIREISL